MRRLRLIWVVAVALAVGCASWTSPANATDGDFPVTVENCGHTLTFAKPPERVLVSTPPLADILVKLGLADSIAAVFGNPHPYTPAPDTAEAFDRLNILVPRGTASREVTLSHRPDFVFVSFPANALDGSQGVATREQYEAAGAQVYIISTQCPSNPAEPTVETNYAEILTLGRIFGIEDRAQEVVDELRGRIAAVQERVAGRPPVKTVYYGESEGRAPLGFWANAIASDIIRLAGGQNLYADQDQDYVQVSAEDLAARDVQAIFVIQQDIAAYFRETFPNLPAVRHDRIVAIEDQNFRDGIRLADAVEEAAKALHPDAFQ